MKRIHLRKLISRILCLSVCAALMLTQSSPALAASKKQKVYEKTIQCTKDEHTHTDECYEVTLVCGMTETGMPGEDVIIAFDSAGLPVSTSQADIAADELGYYHVHGPECYEKVLICTREEHTHKRACRFVDDYGVEDPKEWFDDAPKYLTGDWAADLLMVAKSQVGYEEIVGNCIYDDEGESFGYSRYGDWYGFPYGPWCAMFLSFCAEGAGIPRAGFPCESACDGWVQTFRDMGVFKSPLTYTPKAGDLCFFLYPDKESPTHVAVITGYEPGTWGSTGKFTTIEGNNNHAVRESFRYVDDPDICGYVSISLLQQRYGSDTDAAIVCLEDGYMNLHFGSADAVSGITRLYAKQLATRSALYTEALDKLRQSDVKDKVKASRLKLYQLFIDTSVVPSPVPLSGETFTGAGLTSKTNPNQYAGVIEVNGEYIIYVGT